MPLVNRNGQQWEVSVANMTADEYGNWVRTNPEEAKKLDEPGAPVIVQTGIWKNGMWYDLTNQTQSVKNGVIQ